MYSFLNLNAYEGTNSTYTVKLTDRCEVTALVAIRTRFCLHSNSGFEKNYK